MQKRQSADTNILIGRYWLSVKRPIIGRYRLLYLRVTVSRSASAPHGDYLSRKHDRVRKCNRFLRNFTGFRKGNISRSLSRGITVSGSIVEKSCAMMQLCYRCMLWGRQLVTSESNVEKFHCICRVKVVDSWWKYMCVLSSQNVHCTGCLQLLEILEIYWNLISFLKIL